MTHRPWRELFEQLPPEDQAAIKANTAKVLGRPGGGCLLTGAVSPRLAHHEGTIVHSRPDTEEHAAFRA